MCRNLHLWKNHVRAEDSFLNFPEQNINFCFLVSNVNQHTKGLQSLDKLTLRYNRAEESLMLSGLNMRASPAIYA